MPPHHPWPALTSGVGTKVLLTPDRAGWTWSGLQVLELAPHGPIVVETGPSEAFVLPLSGAMEVTVTVTGGGRGRRERTFSLAGRASVFAGPTDFVYVGRDSAVTIVSDGCATVAIPTARCERRLDAAYGSVADVPTETRGAGRALRHVHNFGVPGVWDHAEKLIACEVLTPPGNWSSYPPHKHDASAPCPVVNEEIYYYRIAGRDPLTPSREGFGFHRTYTGPEHAAAGLTSIDETVHVRDHDVVLVPHGYHGPCAASPDHPMYYLNVMAGPGTERALAFCDDPVHAWVRTSWKQTSHG